MRRGYAFIILSEYLIIFPLIFNLKIMNVNLIHIYLKLRLIGFSFSN